MSIVHRLLAAGLTVAVVGAGAAVPAGANPTPQAPVAQAAKTGRVIVTVRGPKALANQVTLRSTRQRAVLTRRAGTRLRMTRKVRVGTFRVQASPSLLRGQLYRPVVTTKRIRVRAGRTTRTVVTWRKATAPGQIAMTGASSSTIKLAWKGTRATRFEVRRTVGEKAPRRRTAGTRVAIGTPRQVEDTGLAAGQRYAYSLWVRKKINRKQRWLGPVSVVAGTSQADPVTGIETPVYSILPGGTVVDPADRDQVSVRGGRVFVRLAPGRPAPVIGGGVALPISAALPGGYLGKVDQVQPDGRTVRLAQAGLPDLFSQYSLDAEVSDTFDLPAAEINWPSQVPATASGPADADDFTIGPDAVKGSPAGRQERPSPRTPAPAEYERECSDVPASSLGVSVDPIFEASGDLDVDVHSTWGIPHAVQVRADTDLTFGAVAKVETATTVECALSLGEFQLQVVSYPVPMALKYEGKASMYVSGTLKAENVGFTSTLDMGADVRMGSRSHFNPWFNLDGDLLDPQGSGEVEVGLELGGGVTFGPGAGSKNVGAIAGIQGNLTLAKASVTGKFGLDEHNYDQCLNASLGGEASVDLVAEAWAGPLSIGAKHTIWDGEKSYFADKWMPEDCNEDPVVGEGRVQATLRWQNADDMDLHVIDPAGEEIYYGNTTSESGGWLDVDVIPDCTPGQALRNVENVFWDDTRAPSGTYSVRVNEYNNCDDANGAWTLLVRVDDRIVINETGVGTSEVFTFNVQ